MTDTPFQKSATTSPSSTPLSIKDSITYGTIEPSISTRSSENGSLKTTVEEGVSGFSTPLTTPALENTAWTDESKARGTGMDSSTKKEMSLAEETSGKGYAGKETTEQSNSQPLRRPPPAVMRSAAPSPLGPQTNKNLPRIRIPALRPGLHIFGGISPTGQPRLRSRLSSPKSASLSEEEKARFNLLREVERTADRRNATDISRDNGDKTEEGSRIGQYDETIHPAPSGEMLTVLELDVDGTTHAYIIDVSASKEFGRQLNKIIQIYAKREAAEKEKEELENRASDEGILGFLFGALSM
ncbi:hypothetical protein DL98DRAFT_517206 [Cadophora sp. DSE1049]|nr:hypothetical protein DL98DRAFT_517206 [Cadophora sp. DSE1049]